MAWIVLVLITFSFGHDMIVASGQLIVRTKRVALIYLSLKNSLLHYYYPASITLMAFSSWSNVSSGDMKRSSHRFLSVLLRLKINGHLIFQESNFLKFNQIYIKI